MFTAFAFQGPGKKQPEGKLALIDFEDGDRQKVELPNAEVRLAPSSRWREGGDADAGGGSWAGQADGDEGGGDIVDYPVGTRVEMLFDDGVWYPGAWLGVSRESL